MPSRNWRYVLGAIGLSLVVIGSGVWVYYLDNPVPQQARAHKDDAPANRIATPPERVARALEAIEQGQNSQDNGERARRDLDAQEGAWRWTKWSAWAAFVQLILSAVGIAFVVSSLRQGQAGLAAARRAIGHARTANKIARQASEDQTRAWLAITITGKPRLEIPKNLPYVEFTMEIENLGNSPAKEITYFATMCIGYQPHIGYHIGWSQYRKDYLGYVGDLFQGRKEQFSVQAVHSGDKLDTEVGYLVITVYYKTVFSDELRETAVFYEMHDTERDDGLIDFSQRVQAGNLRLKPWMELPGLIG